MTLQLLLAALPMGDDTPVALYCVLALLAIGLIVAMALMGKKNKNDGSDKQDRK